jgi:hypothetical protein
VTALWSAASAWACATCVDPEESSALLIPTLGMSLLPLAMLAGIAWWFSAKVKDARARAATSDGRAPGAVHDMRAPAPLNPEAR